MEFHLILVIGAVGGTEELIRFSTLTGQGQDHSKEVKQLSELLRRDASHLVFFVIFLHTVIIICDQRSVEIGSSVHPQLSSLYRYSLTTILHICKTK